MTSIIGRIVGAGLLAVVWAAPAAAGQTGRTHGIANADLARAGEAAPVRLIDYLEERCDERTVARWLDDLTAGQTKVIVWRGGPCRLVGPGIDSGSRWCAQAEIVLARPLDRDDRPMIEVFFEAPQGGRPGAPYAFRGSLRTADGDDVIRFRRDFEAAWESRFGAPAGAIVDCASDGEGPAEVGAQALNFPV